MGSSVTFEGSELDANSIAGRQPTAGTAEAQDDEVPTQVGDISDISSECTNTASISQELTLGCVIQ